MPSSSSRKFTGLIPPPEVNAKSWTSSGWVSLTTTMRPAFWLRFENVQVTVSPGATSMLETGEPSEQDVWAASQPAGVVCETECPDPGTTLSITWTFDSVPSLSSSSWNEAGVEPPPTVNAKFCGSFGSES